MASGGDLLELCLGIYLTDFSKRRRLSIRLYVLRDKYDVCGPIYVVVFFNIVVFLHTPGQNLVMESQGNRGELLKSVVFLLIFY